ncbi:MAG TPA: glutamate--tRNA ligase [Candidatus Thermoplasmatota archaeon]|nr:glutamate--tRNA ligase [Candidatus Thermoplasmatota archaeon]
MTLDEAAVRRLARALALENAARHGVANPGAVTGRVMAGEVSARAHAQRVAAIVAVEVAAVNAMTPEARAAAAADLGGVVAAKPARAPPQERVLPDLPEAVEGKVVMRFAPNPSGPLTFGHARGVVLHLAYIDRYKGKLILRYDDTDPDVKPPMNEAYEWQREDLAWLGGRADLVLAASDRVPLYYEHAERGLREGALYVCACAPELFRELKGKGEACPHRALPAAEQLAAWRAMLDGTTSPGGAAVRVKTDLQSKNPAWREWVALRIVENPHPRVGSRYRVWPVLDFQSAIDDHLTGVTHILRGKDLADSGHKQRYLYAHFGWTYPQVLHWGRVKMHEFGKFSKSLLTEAIARGEYEGWDDPRLPTLRAMRRRGFQPQAIVAFWLALGLSERDVSASLANLEAENRKLIDARADRVFFVKDPVEVRLEGPAFEAHPLVHPDDATRGTRRLAVREGASVLVPRDDMAELDGRRRLWRLKDGANVAFGETPHGARVLGHAIDAGGKPDRVVHWLPADPSQTCACEVRTPEGVDLGLAERALLEHKPGDIVQFERYGYCRVDAVDATSGRAVLLYTHE